MYNAYMSVAGLYIKLYLKNIIH